MNNETSKATSRPCESIANKFDLMTNDQVHKAILKLPDVSFELTLRKFTESRRKADALIAEADRIMWQSKQELCESLLEDWSAKEIEQAIKATLKQTALFEKQSRKTNLMVGGAVTSIKATSRPLRSVIKGKAGSICRHPDISIVDKEYHEIAVVHRKFCINTMHGWTPELGLAQKLADEIVRAVNEYEALCAVAEAAKAVLTSNGFVAFQGKVATGIALEAALNTLSLVRKGGVA